MSSIEYVSFHCCVIYVNLRIVAAKQTSEVQGEYNFLIHLIVSIEMFLTR